MRRVVGENGFQSEFGYYYADRLDDFAYRDDTHERLGKALNDFVKNQAQPTFEETVYEAFEDAANLLLRKHSDYGPDNILQSPFGPLEGLLVRMWDKYARLKHLLEKSDEADPLNEPLTDTLMDIANYAMIGLLVLQGKFGKGDECNDYTIPKH